MIELPLMYYHNEDAVDNVDPAKKELLLKEYEEMRKANEAKKALLIKEKRKAHYEAHKEERKAYGKTYYEEHKEERKAKRKVYYEEHKEEVKAKKKVYNEANKEEIDAYKKRYYEVHKEEYKEERKAYAKVYYKVHKEKINACKRVDYAMHKKKYHCYHLVVRWFLKSEIKFSFKEKEQILGISKEEFVKYIEKQFRDGMSWDNCGRWHVDHIKAVKSFPNMKEMQYINACYHYTNAQPLWGDENIKKGSRDAMLTCEVPQCPSNQS